MRSLMPVFVAAAFVLAAGTSPMLRSEDATNSKVDASKMESKGNEEPVKLAESAKGWEMYSWKEKDNWFFSLQKRTDRRKTNEEITEKKTKIEGLAALKEELKKLAKRQTVMWNIGAIVGPEKDSNKVSDPSEEMQKEIEKVCDAAGLKLVLDHC